MSWKNVSLGTSPVEPSRRVGRTRDPPRAASPAGPPRGPPSPSRVPRRHWAKRLLAESARATKKPAGTIAGHFLGLSRESTSVSFSPAVLRHDSIRAVRGPRSPWAAPCLPPHRVSPVQRESREVDLLRLNLRSCWERALWVAPPFFFSMAPAPSAAAVCFASSLFLITS